ncbi:uncharacterized protein LAESUDRAFT_728445 [Laetiporus sulphureus 93-53]|uniref:Condensation domain-containing protein n=1 Tax=Laetiporus sulphureus 93-53 TaxID=1314785 RepID=A0A165D5W2_9APHY|nr:uncharacterized protein LAESUDRAFT_728445 [Laetiporus sulphureus 93-53]KZT04207.1 hypothetical protein LAESUDRAFT_728445 [Laetiporus sulphureus 93-53]
MTASDALFHEASPGVFTRKCIGMEAMSCFASEFGCSHVVSSCSVKLANEIAPEDLKKAIQSSMIRLRHLVPGIAVKASPTRPPMGDWSHEYRVPDTLEDVFAWVEEVVFVHENGTSFLDNHERIFHESWWRATEGRYSYELHIVPNLSAGSNSWTFVLSAHHSNADARSKWMVFDKVFEFLCDELDHVAPPLSSFEWGKEVSRLPTAGQMVWSVYDTGKPEPLPIVDPSTAPVAPENVIPWSYPVRVSNDNPHGTDITSAVRLTPEETVRFHGACKAHGKTVTMVVTALQTLADLEASLHIAGKVGPERFKKVWSGYNTATHFPLSSLSIDMRQRMPEAYRKFGLDQTTPLMAMDVVALLFAFEPYRKLVKADEASLTASRNADKSLFWDELVPSVEEVWKSQDISIEAYRTRAATFTAMANNPDLELDFHGSIAPACTSIGDMTRLGYLEAFRPASGHKTLIVEDLTTTAHSGSPGAVMNVVQYDNELRLKLVRGSKFTTQEDLDLQGRVLKEWIQLMTRS